MLGVLNQRILEAAGSIQYSPSGFSSLGVEVACDFMGSSSMCEWIMEGIQVSLCQGDYEERCLTFGGMLNS